MTATVDLRFQPGPRDPGAVTVGPPLVSRTATVLSAETDGAGPTRRGRLRHLHQDGAAGDIQDDAGDPGCLVRGEVEGRAGHVVRRGDGWAAADG